jgi:hypothetical protein
MIELHIPAVPPGPNGPRGMLRSHWTKRRKIRDEWYYLVHSAVTDAQAWNYQGSGNPVEVHIHQCRKRLMDQDNLVASCKVILDVLKMMDLIMDDSPQWLTLTVTQEVRRACFTTIELEYTRCRSKDGRS